MAQPWTASDPTWAKLTPYQKAAAMALMEADRKNPSDARDAAGAMINRAAKSGQDLGAHVSTPTYQPTIEEGQHARLKSIINSGDFSNLTSWVQRRANGEEPDPVNGATHFLAPEKTMLALEARDPQKYHNWGPNGANWTGYDPATGSYKGVVLRDTSHAFLAPEGAYSAPYKAQATPDGSPGYPSGAYADNSSVPPILQGGFGRQPSTQDVASTQSPTTASSTATPNWGLGLPTSATSLASALPKSAGSLTSSLASAFGGGTSVDQDKQAQALTKSAQDNNASMLNQAQQSQQMAEQRLARFNPKIAAMYGAFA